METLHLARAEFSAMWRTHQAVEVDHLHLNPSFLPVDEKPVVIFIAGDDKKGAVWMPWVKAFADTAWCYTFTHNGTIQMGDESIAGHLERVLEEVKGREVWIVGHSLGGTASIYLKADGFFEEVNLKGIFSIAGRVIDDKESWWRSSCYGHNEKFFKVIARQRENLAGTYAILPDRDWLMRSDDQKTGNMELLIQPEGTSHVSVRNHPLTIQSIKEKISAEVSTGDPGLSNESIRVAGL